MNAAPARAAIDASAATALAGTNGKAMIDAGDALYGVGAYAEAVPLYRAALNKGGDAGLICISDGACALCDKLDGIPSAVTGVMRLGAKVCVRRPHKRIEESNDGRGASRRPFESVQSDVNRPSLPPRGIA